MTPDQLDWTQGRPVVLVSTCRSCSYRWYLPRDVCSFCGGQEIARDPSAGTGVVLASTTFHRSTDRRRSAGAAVGIALVDLDEGVRVMGRCPAQARPGLRVVAAFTPVQQGGYPPSLVLDFKVASP